MIDPARYPACFEGRIVDFPQHVSGAVPGRSAIGPRMTARGQADVRAAVPGAAGRRSDHLAAGGSVVGEVSPRTSFKVERHLRQFAEFRKRRRVAGRPSPIPPGL